MGRLEPGNTGAELSEGAVDAAVAVDSSVEIYNPNPFAVDVSWWRLEGPATFNFPPGAHQGGKHSRERTSLSCRL